MARWRLSTVCLLALGASVALAEPARVPEARASLTVGAVNRNHTLWSLGPEFQASRIQGLAPTSLHLNTAWFPLGWLGADLDAAFATFAAKRGTSTQLIEGSVAPSVAARWSPTPWLRLEGAIGYLLQTDPIMLVDAADPQVFEPGAIFSHGPTARVGVGASLGAFDAMLFARGLITAGGNLGGVQTLNSGRGYEFGLRAGVAVLDLDRVRATVVGRVGFRHLWASGYGTVDDLSLGLGIELSAVPPRPAPVTSTSEARVLVAVRLAGGKPALGARVRVGSGAPAVVDAAGELHAKVSPGEVGVSASLDGFEAASARVVAEAGKETIVTLLLQPVTGPGTIAGVAQLEDGTPLPKVEVVTGTGVKATTDEQGAFTLSKVGPGVVPLTLTAAGYLKKEELVQVPPGGTAKVTVVLTPSAEPLKATLRGSIRSITGRPVTASVRITGSKTKVKVGADGRFEVQLEAGTWSLVISAPRHVTQTKSVTLAPGDQAIFQVDLQPGG